jgi:hypothetical protein
MNKLHAPLLDVALTRKTQVSNKQEDDKRRGRSMVFPISM